MQSNTQSDGPLRLNFNIVRAMVLAIPRIVLGCLFIVAGFAQADGLDAVDNLPPEIRHQAPGNNLQPGSPVRISATVSDNAGVRSVILFYRTQGSENYSKLFLDPADGTDRYAVVLTAGDVQPPGLEYYLQASDLSGNTRLHGFSHSPLTVPVFDPLLPQPSAAAPVTSPLVQTGNTWLWVTVGVVLVGAVVAAQDDEEEDNSGSIVITGPPPFRF